MVFQFPAELWVILSAVLYGCLGYFGTELMHAGLSISSLLFWRFSLASLFLLVIMRSQGVRVQRGSFGIRISALILCALLYAGSSAFYFMATTRIGTALATIFLFFYPAFVMFLAWNIDKRPLTRITFITLASLFLGIFLLNFHQTIRIDGGGILFSILSAAFYALYMFFGEKHVRQISPILSTFSVCLVSALTFLGMSLAEDSLQVPGHFTVWRDIGILSIFCTCLPVLFLFEGLKTMDSGRVAILSTIEPVVTVSLGAYLLGEVLTLYQFLGAGAILGAGILFHFEKGTPIRDSDIQDRCA